MSCNAGDVECADETVRVPGIGSGEIYQMASELYDWTGTFRPEIYEIFKGLLKNSYVTY